jgi:hypothetical protein
MKSCQRPPLPVARQLSLLAETTRPRLSPDERREVVTLLAGLLIEANDAVTPEAADDRG